MKKIIVIMLICSLLVLSGCNIPKNGVCIEQKNIKVQQTDNKTWNVLDGSISIKECDDNENKSVAVSSEDNLVRS